MSFNETLIQSIIVLAGLISLGALLRHAGILKQEHSSVFSRIITDITLPALIFGALSVHKFNWSQAAMPVVMVIAEAACILLALLASRVLKLSRPRAGALVLASAFGSSAFLGYALVKEVFADNAGAISDAVLISELGVGSLIFTVGVMIAIYFGSGALGTGERFKPVLNFFRSPIFVSLVLGILCSMRPLPMNNVIVSTVYKIVHTLARANTLMVALTIGVMLRFKDLRRVLHIVLVVCAIKLIIQPLMVFTQANWLGFAGTWKKVLVMEAAMPSATLSAVFAARYGCDSELASVLVFTTIICSIVTIVGLVSFLV